MKKKEYREVTVKREITYEVICDGCGKTIKGDLPDDWYEFSAHHEEWENDPIDSIDHYQCCSAKCYFKALEKACEDFEEYNTSVIDRKDLDFVKNIINFVKQKEGLKSEISILKKKIKNIEKRINAGIIQKSLIKKNEPAKALDISNNIEELEKEKTLLNLDLINLVKRLEFSNE